MSLLVDHKLLNLLSKDNWNDNWNFREYLINHVEPGSIDRKAQQLDREVTAKIDCTKCGNCCRESKPSLSAGELDRLATAKGISILEFTNQFTCVDETNTRTFNQSPCPLLNGTRCSVYPARPFDCASYPHLQEPDFIGGSIHTIENYRVCPIVFNVYEQMKSSFDYDPAIDYYTYKK